MDKITKSLGSLTIQEREPHLRQLLTKCGVECKAFSSVHSLKSHEAAQRREKPGP